MPIQEDQPLHFVLSFITICLLKIAIDPACSWKDANRRHTKKLRSSKIIFHKIKQHMPMSLRCAKLYRISVTIMCIAIKVGASLKFPVLTKFVCQFTKPPLTMDSMSKFRWNLFKWLQNIYYSRSFFLFFTVILQPIGVVKLLL